MGCTLLLALTIGAGLPQSAAAQIYCRNFGADPNDYVDDAETLQNCFNSAPSGATVVLDPGNPGYVLNAHGLTFGANNLTITSSQAPTQTAIIIAGQNLSTLMLDQENAGLTFHITYITFEGMVDTPGWRINCNGNIFLRGNGFEFAHNEVKHSCTGIGLEVSADGYNIWDNYIAYNGVQKYDALNRWSDGITALRCNHGSIHDNVLVDNTDIDIVVGGGPSCSVYNNTIWHGGKYAFAGLNLGSFVDSYPYIGVHYQSSFTGNTIQNTSFNHLGQGLSIGSHPWPDGVGQWVRDTGTVTGNDISGANVNLLIEGLGIPNSNTGGIDPAPGSIFGNNAHDAMGNSDCAGAYNYAVNPDHAKGTYDGGYTPLVWDGGTCSG